MNTSRAVPVTFFLLRVVTGLLFFQHGAQKLLGWFGGFGETGTAPLMSLMGLAGVLELAGGILIMIGFLTQPVTNSWFWGTNKLIDGWAACCVLLALLLVVVRWPGSLAKNENNR